jgi:DNA-binding CsgD family transcriptional regulator
MSDANVATMAEIAAIACSGSPVEDRMCEVIESLRAIMPIDGAAASLVDPTSGVPRILVNAGYPQDVADHVSGRDYHAEVVAPWALPRRGYPVRERDLGVDPLTLRCNVEYFRPAGFVEGLVSALVTPDGRFVGALDLGVSDVRHPSDEACAFVGQLAPALANLVDPLQSATALATLLGGRSCRAVGIFGDDEAVVLRGEPPQELLDALVAYAASAPRAGPGTSAFLWPDEDGGWHRCHVLRCRDGALVLVLDDAPDVRGLTPRELEVLTCMVAGRSNADIARDLWIAVRTARAHVEHILTKLDVPSRAAAVARAMEEGLVLSPALAALRTTR